MPQYRPHEPEKGWIIPKTFQAFLRAKPAEDLIAALRPKPTPTQARAFHALVEPRKYFVSQHAFFCYVIDTIGYTEITPDPNDANRQAMIYALLMSNSLWYPLRYPAEYEGGQTINQRIHYHYPTARDIDQILSLNNFRDFGGGNIYNASFGFLDQNPHNTMHIWTGGQKPRVRPQLVFAVLCLRQTGAGERFGTARAGVRRPTQLRRHRQGPKVPFKKRPILAAPGRRHVLQPHRVLRSDILARARQCRSVIVGMADAQSHRSTARPRFGVVAVELHNPRHARDFSVRL